jgi:2-amino-4-hydroxy-6-hydroxymethyldihydropteridine diphosphokinase
MNRVFLTLGSNIDKEQNLPAAVRILGDMATVIAVSSVYETKPSGTANQPRFFNAAVLIETPLDPLAIKEHVIEEIESALDRERQEDRNAPRTIDIDIALFNDDVVDYTPSDGRKRHVPDADLLLSVHAIVPIAELAADKKHPETGESLGEIAERLQADADENTIRLRKDISLAA